MFVPPKLIARIKISQPFPDSIRGNIKRRNVKRTIDFDFPFIHEPLFTCQNTNALAGHEGVEDGLDFGVKIWRLISHSARDIENNTPCNASSDPDKPHSWQPSFPFHTKHKPFLQKSACSSVGKGQRSFLSDAPEAEQFSSAGTV